MTCQIVTQTGWPQHNPEGRDLWLEKVPEGDVGTSSVSGSLAQHSVKNVSWFLKEGVRRKITTGRKKREVGTEKICKEAWLIWKMRVVRMRSNHEGFWNPGSGDGVGCAGWHLTPSCLWPNEPPSERDAAESVAIGACGCGGRDVLEGESFRRVCTRSSNVGLSSPSWRSTCFYSSDPAGFLPPSDTRTRANPLLQPQVSQLCSVLWFFHPSRQQLSLLWWDLSDSLRPSPLFINYEPTPPTTPPHLPQFPSSLEAGLEKCG